MGQDNPWIGRPLPRQTFTVEVMEDFLNHVEEGVLGVEVWGHRRSGFMDLQMPTGDPENEGKRQKSFPEK